MKELDEIHQWILKRKEKNPNWALPENTMQFIVGLEIDLEELSKQLGVDLCIMTIRDVKD
jgi:hypothetical protein